MRTSIISACIPAPRASALMLWAAWSLTIAVVEPRDARAGEEAIFVNGFESSAGVLLAGAPEALALDAVVDMQPVGVPNADIDGDLILTRMDVAFSRSATVGQINAALTGIGAGIVTMTPKRAELTVAIPRPADRAQLRQLRDTLEVAPGVLSADLALLPQPEFLPLEVPHSSVSYLAATRFPAAWNARRLATDNCQARKVEMRFVDIWGTNPPAAYDTFSAQVPGFNGWSGDRTSLAETHGYETVATTAAILDANKPNGTNPFSQCVNIVGLDSNGMTVSQTQKMLAESLPTGKVIVNRSMGFHAPPCSQCLPEDVGPEYRNLPANLARQTIQWRSLMRERDADMFVSVAAGNEYDTDAGHAYPFFAQTTYVSPEALAASGVIFGPSASLDFLQDHALLDPDTAHATLPSLVQSDNTVARVQTYQAETLGPALPGSAFNILAVGSTTNEPRFDAVRPSLFSRRDAPVSAVGEHIENFGAADIRGTSFASPQIAALASYMWLLSDDLRSRPASETVKAIIDNKRTVEDVNLIDAYATVLSLDDAFDTILPTPNTMPIRLAVLDVDDSGAFDEGDLLQLKAELVDNIVANGEPHQQTWGRADLNGDGYVGGSRTVAFDLDRRGSTRYGLTNYGTVQFTAETRPTTLDESTIIDFNILCYYAYSPLYTGSASARTNLLGAPCAASYPPTPADEGQYWQNLVNSGTVAFMSSTVGKPGDVQQGIRVGAWVARFDMTTGQMGERLQLAPPIASGPNAGKPDVLDGSLIINASTMGDAMAIWVDNAHHVWFSRFESLNGQWSAAQPFPEDESGFVGVGGLVLDGLGNAMAITLQYIVQNPTPWTYRYSYYDKVAGQWSPQATIGLSDSTGLLLSLSATNQLDRGHALVANKGDTIFFGLDSTKIYRFDRATRTWAGPETISEPARPVSLALDGASNLLATWSSSSIPLAMHSRHRDAATGQWSPPLTIENAFNGGLVGDDQGNAIATWSTNVPRPIDGHPAPQLRASYYRAAIGEWDPPTALSTSPFGALLGDGGIGMASVSGRARLVYHQLLDYSAQPEFGPFLSRPFDPLVGWGPPELFQHGLMSNPRHAMVTTSATGTSLVLYCYQNPPTSACRWDTMH